MAFAGSITRLTRVNIIDVLDQVYITTARAKGLREKLVLSRHALKPAMIPVVTVIGLQMAIILGGTVITETLFNLPGLGKLIVDSIYLRDFPVVQGAMLMLAFGFVMINLLVDMLYGVLDPRMSMPDIPVARMAVGNRVVGNRTGNVLAGGGVVPAMPKRSVKAESKPVDASRRCGLHFDDRSR